MSYHKKYGHHPNQAIADAGYGSLENYGFLDTNHIESYMKYNYFHNEQSRENLLSEKGHELRGRRCTEVEQTFGQIKWNKKFNRFLLRRVPKVSIEIGIIAIAQKY